MREFARFFSQTFTVLGTGGPSGPFSGPPASTWQPSIDIYECHGHICVHVELPGVDKDKIEVSVEGGVLKIAGYRAKNLPEGVEHVHQMEIPYGHFARLVGLPESADVQKIHARFENGFLLIDIPRKAVE